MTKTLLNTKQVELIRKKKFIVVTFYIKNEIFVIYKIFFSPNSDIYLFCKVEITLLKVDKTFNFILSNNIEIIDIFFKNLVAKLLKYTRINNHTINLVKSQ